MTTKPKALSYRYGFRWKPLLVLAFGLCLLAFSFWLLPSQRGQAATGINPQLNFQGRLLDSTGAVVADGLYNMEFTIVQDGDGCNPTSGTYPCSGTVEWTETRKQTNRVTVANGYFSVNLGSVTAFSGSVDWNQDTLWLGINIGGTANTATPTWDGVMKPLKRLTSTPYALNSDRLGGLQASNFVQLAQGVQSDGSSTNPSIFINKTAGTANILELQKSSSDVFVIDNSGRVGIGQTPSTTGGRLDIKSGGSSDPLAIYASDGSELFHVREASNGAGAVYVHDSSGNERIVLDGQNDKILLGAANDVNLYRSAASTLKTDSYFVQQNAADSTTAFLIQNQNSKEVVTVDTSGNQLLLGKLGASNINGKLIFNSATASNYQVGLTVSSSQAASYTLTLPTAAPTTSKCLGTDATTATLLIFTTCGGGGGVSDGDKGDIVVSGSGTVWSVDSDVLDFSNLSDGMTLDASTSIGFGASNYGLTFNDNGSGDFTVNLSSTGDFVIQDNGTPVFTIADNGTADIGPGSGAITLIAGSGSAVSITGHAVSTFTTDAGALTLTGAAASTWSTSSGLLTITGTGGLTFTTGSNNDVNITPGGSGGVVISSNTTLNAQSDLRFADSDSSNWVAFQAPSTVGSNVTWTLPSADSAGCLQSNGSGTLSISTCGDTNIQSWTSGTNNTWTKPSGALLVIFEAWGGGGGGAGGQGGDTTATRSGGGGGGGGGYLSLTFQGSFFSGNQVVTVGGGGSGTAGTTGGTTPTDASAGGNSCFSSSSSCGGTVFALAGGGGGGAGNNAGSAGGGGGGQGAAGTSATAATFVAGGGNGAGITTGAAADGFGGSASTTATTTAASGGLSQYGGAAGGSSTTTGASGSGSGGSTFRGGAGGGAGGSSTVTTCAARPGGSGGNSPATAAGGGGTNGTGQLAAPGGAGTAGTDGDDSRGGQGGGGGGNSCSASAAGGAGANGGARGGGGGGGGSTENATPGTGGTGGNGGSGFARVTTLRGSGADLAETYCTNDPSLAAGDAVALDPDLKAGVKKTRSIYDPQAIGIISTSPGLTTGLLEDNCVKPVLVALAGRVPLKVSLENGPIHKGDLLTASSKPGIAMKATKAGTIIGQAMTEYIDPDLPGYIVVFVKSSQGVGSHLSDAVPGLNAAEGSGTIEQQALAYFAANKNNPSDAAQLSEITTDRLNAALEIITPSVITDNLSVNTIQPATGKTVAIELGDDGQFIIRGANGQQVLSIDSEGNVAFNATVTVDKFAKNQVNGLQTLNAKTSPQASASSPTNGLTTQSANGLSDGDFKNLQSINLVVLAQIESRGGLLVDGDAQFNGNVLFNMLAQFQGDASFGKHIISKGDAPKLELGDAAGLQVTPDDNPSANLASAAVDGNDISGKLGITLGDNADSGQLVTVKFKKTYANAPQVFITPVNQAAAQSGYYVATSKDGFVIFISNPLNSTDKLQFNYWVVE